MIDLACPESCPYLINARASAVERERELRRREPSTIGAPDLSLNQRALTCVQAIERALVDAARGVGELSIHDLDDTEILAAIENAVKNLETEESGLIYEHRAGTSRAYANLWMLLPESCPQKRARGAATCSRL